MSNKMTDEDLVKLCRERYDDSIHNDSGFIKKNEKLRDQIRGALYGDEKKNRSHALSRDMADVEKAMMTAINKTLNGSDNSFSFTPVSSSPEDIKEAEEKSIFVNEIIKSQPDYHTLMQGWQQTALGQSASTMKCYIEEKTETKEIKHANVTKSNLGGIDAIYDNDVNVSKFDIIEKTEEKSALTDEEKTFIKTET